MSAPKVVFGKRSLIKVQIDPTPIARCIVDNKVVSADRRQGSIYCSEKCAHRAYAMRKRGEEPNGIWVKKSPGRSGPDHWRSKRKAEQPK